MNFITGMEVNLYLDADGLLVISTAKRPELTPLPATRTVTLRAALDEQVVANVEIAVSQLEILLPLPQARFVLDGMELTGHDVRQVQTIQSALARMADRRSDYSLEMLP